jgi:hypothetical protein
MKKKRLKMGKRIGCREGSQMPRVVPKVDRLEEILLFEQMATGRRPEKVFALEDVGRKGKTSLLDMIERKAQQLDLVCARIDFRDTVFDVPEFLAVMHHKLHRSASTIAHGTFSTTVLSTFTELTVSLRLVDTRPVGLDIGGSAVNMQGTAKESRIAGRDIIESGAHVSYSYSAPPEQRGEVERGLAQAFLRCLGAACSSVRIVLLFDTFEQASASGDWLIKKVLARLRDEWPVNLITCIFGRSVPGFIGWDPIVQRQGGLTPFSLQVHGDLVRQLGLNLSAEEIAKHFGRLQGDPANTAWFYSILA